MLDHYSQIRDFNQWRKSISFDTFNFQMRICSWNINGLRSLRQPLRNVLEQLDCDIICFQETKVTRELIGRRFAISSRISCSCSWSGQALAEEYARIDGYHTFYSWSRLRQGYSGVAIFCKTSLSPIRAEEGTQWNSFSSIDSIQALP